MLLEAFHRHFNNHPYLVTAVAGGFWTGEVPEGVPYPYAYLHLNHVDSLPLMSSYQMEFGRTSVHVYALGAESAEATIQLFKKAFDYQDLPFDPGTDTHCVSMVPSRYQLVSENLRHKSGKLVFRATQSYSLVVQKPKHPL